MCASLKGYREKNQKKIIDAIKENFVITDSGGIEVNQALLSDFFTELFYVFMHNNNILDNEIQCIDTMIKQCKENIKNEDGNKFSVFDKPFLNASLFNKLLDSGPSTQLYNALKDEDSKEIVKRWWKERTGNVEDNEYLKQAYKIAPLKQIQTRTLDTIRKVLKKERGSKNNKASIVHKLVNLSSNDLRSNDRRSNDRGVINPLGGVKNFQEDNNKEEKVRRKRAEIQKSIVKGFCNNQLRWYDNTNEEEDNYFFINSLNDLSDMSIKTFEKALSSSAVEATESIKEVVKKMLTTISNTIKKNNIILMDNNNHNIIYDISADTFLLQPLLQYLAEQFFFSVSNDKKAVTEFNKHLNNLVLGSKEDIEQQVDMIDSNYRAFIKIYFIDKWNEWLFSNKISVEEKKSIKEYYLKKDQKSNVMQNKEVKQFDKKESNNAIRKDNDNEENNDVSEKKDTTSKKENKEVEIKKKIVRCYFSFNDLQLSEGNILINKYDFFNGLREYSREALNNKNTSFSLTKENIEKFVEEYSNLVENYIKNKNITIDVTINKEQYTTNNNFAYFKPLLQYFTEQLFLTNRIWINETRFRDFYSLIKSLSSDYLEKTYYTDYGDSVFEFLSSYFVPKWQGWWESDRVLVDDQK